MWKEEVIELIPVKHHITIFFYLGITANYGIHTVIRGFFRKWFQKWPHLLGSYSNKTLENVTFLQQFLPDQVKH